MKNKTTTNFFEDITFLLYIIFYIICYPIGFVCGFTAGFKKSLMTFRKVKKEYDRVRKLNTVGGYQPVVDDLDDNNPPKESS